MIYLDHNATTPMDERVVDAMQPYLSRYFGNPSSLHTLGRLSRGAVDQAREQVAALIGAKSSQIVFTSGGTEANNFAIKGYAQAHPGGLIAFGATEHPSVLEVSQYLTGRGYVVEHLPVDAAGQICLESLLVLLDRGLNIVSVMLANNETGVIQDLAAIVRVLRGRDVVLHSDAVQAIGKIPVDFGTSGVQMMSLSSHKIAGPKGMGALAIDHHVMLEPLLHGGGQERGLRGGTENVAAIVGFGKAAELARMELTARVKIVSELKDRLEAYLDTKPGITLFARDQNRLPNTVQFAVEGLDGEMLVMMLDRAGIAISSGSACASGGGEPSPVLMAMGVPADLAKAAVRISFGYSNTTDDADRLIAMLNQLCPAPVVGANSKP